MIRKSASCIILVFLLASCADTANTFGRKASSEYLRQPVTQFSGVEEMYTTYRSGIEKIMESIPDNGDSRTGSLPTLSNYKALYKNLGWSRIDREGTIWSMTSGRVPGCWVGFIESDNPALQQRTNTLHTILNENRNALVIVRPDKVSEKWAGIFLMHELSHAKDFLEKGETAGAADEYHAYDLEKAAYNHSANGAFNKALDDVIDLHTITNTNELLGRGRGQVSEYLREIDRRMNEALGQSIAEMEMRYGFYLISIVLRLSERAGQDTGTAIEELNKAIAQISMF